MSRRAWGCVALLGATVSAVALSGCATAGGVKPETARAIIQEFHAAGCGGDFNLNTTLGIGQLGGSVAFNLDINAECPVGDYPVTPLSSLGERQR